MSSNHQPSPSRNCYSDHTVSQIQATKVYKEKGNGCFSQKDFAAAISIYRQGLTSLLSIETSSIENTELRELEVTLRSNLALSLLKLAEIRPTNPHTNSDDLLKLKQYFLECEKQCSAALELEQTNPKLWYRRGQAYQKLAILEHESCSEYFSKAESDLKRSEELLHAKLGTRKWDEKTDGIGKQTIMHMNQMNDVRKALESLELVRRQTCENNSATIQNVTYEENQCARDAPNEFYESCSTSVSKKEKDAKGSDLDHYKKHNALHVPSSDQQKKIIMQLLSRQQLSTSETDIQSNHARFPLVKGEAYCLINMSWWQSWCRYVNFFAIYLDRANPIKSKKKNSKTCVTANEPKINHIDIMNERSLQLLPPGATLPPYVEISRKEALGQGQKNSGAKSSNSFSSDDSGDESEIGKAVNVPGVIDNFMLIYKHDEFVSTSRDIDQRDKIIHLKSNLVRGYHFEILPREAFAALRYWYGESSPTIMRRISNIEELPWVNSLLSSNRLLLRLPLYSERWQISSNYSHERRIGQSYFKNGDICGACRSPFASTRCTSCRDILYCNKQCQSSHWPYHEKTCRLLAKQQQHKSNVADRNSGLLPKKPAWGRIGLNNLGNTCFMNSAIQCMSHVTPLTRYFLSNKFAADINKSNLLGTGGKVANAYGSLMKDLWMGKRDNSSLSPTSLKRAIELFAPRFSGVSQQDSAEFLAYLLDALHEDLNRIRNPPYVVLPDVDRGKKLSICGVEAWDAHCRRNSSYVFENFYGLYKSTCVCPQCDSISVTFDTFNHITLEIPQIEKIHLFVVLVRGNEHREPRIPVKYCVSVPQNGIVEDLISALIDLIEESSMTLTICSVDVDRCNITRLYRDGEPVSSLLNDKLVVAYETSHLKDSSKVTAVIRQYFVNDHETTENSFLGLPLMITIERNVKCNEVYNILWKYLKPFAMLDRKKMRDPSFFEKITRSKLLVRVTDPSEREPHLFRMSNEEGMTSILSQTSTEKVFDLLDIKPAQEYVFFAVGWINVVACNNYQDINAKIKYSNFFRVTNHSSVFEYERCHMQENNTITLDQCFESFTQPEQLDDDNMWYCAQCKEHVGAMKTVALWRLPNILVIHLKRFEYKNSFNRSKIGTLVDFPIDGFDLKRHSAYNSCIGSDSSPELVDDEAPLIYDLFGVTNHMGRMGFGHYTAYARRWSECGIENVWAEFDDEIVKEVDGNDVIVSPAAYVLFYRKRDFF